MNKKRDKRKQRKKEEQAMNATINQARPYTVSESITQACKEVKNMREGRTPKRSLNDLFTNIEKWSKEEEK